jgi:hypothetical protein
MFSIHTHTSMEASLKYHNFLGHGGDGNAEGDCSVETTRPPPPPAPLFNELVELRWLPTPPPLQQQLLLPLPLPPMTTSIRSSRAMTPTVIKVPNHMSCHVAHGRMIGRSGPYGGKSTESMSPPMITIPCG